MPVLDPIATLLDAIKAQLEKGFPATRWHYSEQNESMSSDEFSELIRSVPHIGLAWASWNSDGKGNRRHQGKLGFKVWIVVKHPKLEGRLRGDPKGPGLYPSAVLAAQLLQGLTIPGLGSIMLGAVAPAFAQGFDQKGVSVAMIEGSVNATLDDVGGLVDGLPPFTGLDVDWELARENGNATEPDAEDEIALPGAS